MGDEYSSLWSMSAMNLQVVVVSGKATPDPAVTFCLKWPVLVIRTVLGTATIG